MSIDHGRVQPDGCFVIHLSGQHVFFVCKAAQGYFRIYIKRCSVHRVLELQGCDLQVWSRYSFPIPVVLKIEFWIAERPTPAKLVTHQLFLKVHRFFVSICPGKIHWIILDEAAILHHHARSKAVKQLQSIYILSSEIIEMPLITIMTIPVKLKIVGAVKMPVLLAGEMDGHLPIFIVQLQISGIDIINVPSHIHTQGISHFSDELLQIAVTDLVDTFRIHHNLDF